MQERYTFDGAYSMLVEKEAATARKGIPVPGTGKRSRYSNDDAGRSNGVSGGSHVVSHRYVDDGDNGPQHRREIRRRETLLWHDEIWEALEQYAAGDF